MRSNNGLEDEVKKLDFFKYTNVEFVYNHKLYMLQNTSYGLIFFDKSDVCGWLKVANIQAPIRLDFQDATFEEVFTEAPACIQEKLIYHLNLFR